MRPAPTSSSCLCQRGPLAGRSLHGPDVVFAEHRCEWKGHKVLFETLDDGLECVDALALAASELHRRCKYSSRVGVSSPFSSDQFTASAWLIDLANVCRAICTDISHFPARVL